jgi:CYTH domain-containing protein
MSTDNNVEIERRFLVDIPKWEAFKRKAKANSFEILRINQGYLTQVGSDVTARIRTIKYDIIEGVNAEFTVKGPRTGTCTQTEFNSPYDYVKAEAILKMLTRKISKVRYEFSYVGKIWSVDEFLDGNRPLVVAEIELTSEKSKFRKPLFATVEITSISSLSNAALAELPISAFESHYRSLLESVLNGSTEIDELRWLINWNSYRHTSCGTTGTNKLVGVTSC